MTLTTYRIVLAPFQPIQGGVQRVVEELAPKGFRPDQLCLVGKPSSIAPLSSYLGSTGLIYPHLVADLEQLHLPWTNVPVVASPGPILDILLKQQSWLSSTTAAPLRRPLNSDNVVLCANGDDHDQFVHAARLMLRYGCGDLSTHIFRWPQDAVP